MKRPRKKHGWMEKPYLLGVLQGPVFRASRRGNTKGPTWFSVNKSHAAWSMNQVVEPEAGRTIQSQMINLVIGVVTRSLAAADPRLPSSIPPG